MNRTSRRIALGLIAIVLGAGFLMKVIPPETDVGLNDRSLFAIDGSLVTNPLDVSELTQNLRSKTEPELIESHASNQPNHTTRRTDSDQPFRPLLASNENSPSTLGSFTAPNLTNPQKGQDTPHLGWTPDSPNSPETPLNPVISRPEDHSEGGHGTGGSGSPGSPGGGGNDGKLDPKDPPLDPDPTIPPSDLTRDPPDITLPPDGKPSPGPDDLGKADHFPDDPVDPITDLSPDDSKFPTHSVPDQSSTVGLLGASLSSLLAVRLLLGRCSRSRRT